MSYEIATNVSIKEKGIFVTSACNNVHPRTYEKWEYGTKLGTLEEKKRSLTNSLLGGDIQPRISVNGYKLAYANAVARDYMHKNDIDSFEIWKKWRSDEAEWIEKVDTVNKVFWDAYAETKKQGEYVVRIGGSYVVKLTKGGYRYEFHENERTKHPYKKAYIFHQRLNNALKEEVSLELVK